MAYVFDGVAKVITLSAGTISVNVDDLYSRWVDWLRLSDNSKYPLAFRYVGADTISATKSLGVTFFLTNDWRIRPQEASHRLSINGNLYTDPSGFSPIINTIGTFNVIVETTVSSLVDAAIAQLPEIEQASFNNRVAIDVVNGTAGTAYPIGTQKNPVKSLADAKLIATLRGFDEFYIIGNLTIGASDVISTLKFYGQGVTLNSYKTTITFIQGCITEDAHYYNSRITGYQGGESFYHDCMIDGLENAMCIYERCGFLDGTARGWTVKQSSVITNDHATYYKECFSDEGTTIIDRNGAQLNLIIDDFSGRLKIINQNNALSGTIWVHLNGGTLTVDSTNTTGKIFVTGVGSLINTSTGTEVDASGFLSEGFEQMKVNLESSRPTHQGFGARWFVDPINGNDLSPGNSSSSPVKTLTAAHTKAVSGRGDVIYLLAPGAGVATIDERITITKEDLHIRGPGRGLQIQPSTANLGPVVTIAANNCSMSGFIVRTPIGSTTDDGIVVSGKFSRMEKLYLAGSGQTGFGTISRGIVFTGGDYHELHDMEVEKFGSNGVEMEDLSAFHSNGAPREISIFGGNIYLNGGHGVHVRGKDGVLPGLTSRFIRILRGANIFDNLGYGILTDANTTGVVLDSSVLIHNNNGGDANPQTLFNGTGHYETADVIVAMADAVRTELTPELTKINNQVDGLTTNQQTMLLEIYKLYGLSPFEPLIVTPTSRSAGTINQSINSNTNQTTITRV